MKKRSSILINSIIVTGIALLLTACGGGGGGDSSSASTAPLTVAITDAPVDGASEVVITFTSVTVQANDGTRTTYPVEDPLTGEPGRTIDLLTLGQGAQVVLLDNVALKYGHYSWIRLDVDLSYPDKSYIKFENNPDAPYELRCPSCAQSDLKLNRSFTVGNVCDTNGSDEPCGTGEAGVAFTIDFDLRKSITDPQSGDYYKLRPTLRIVETQLAGNFTGKVDSSLIPGNATVEDGASTGCSVYTFAGNNISPDDIFIDDSGTHTNPVTTADVKREGDIFTYTAAFLLAGDYTAALTCNAGNDNPETDENDVVFLDQQNVTVEMGVTTENVDFPTGP